MRKIFLFAVIMLLAFASSALSEEMVYAYGDFLYELLEDGTVGVIGYNGSDAHLVIPAELDGKKVSVIGATNLEDSWKYRIGNGNTISIEIEEGIKDLIPSVNWDESLRTIYLPDSLICEMRGWARTNPFKDCENLEEIKVAENHPVFEIRDGALIDKNRQELIAYPAQRKSESIAIPESVRRIGSFAYYWNEVVKEIIIPEGIEEIGRYAFAHTNIVSIHLPATLKKLEEEAFTGCDSLKEIDIAENNSELMKIDGALILKESQQLIWMEKGIKEYVIPEGVKSIGNGLFQGARELISIEIPEGVEEIERYAFSFTNLKNVRLPETLMKLGQGVFRGCRDLSYINIPKNVTIGGDNPFSGCVSLKEIEVAEDHPKLVKINGMLILKESQDLICVEAGHKDYVIPEGVRSIADGAFQGIHLRTVSIPEGIETIGKTAFEATGLRRITLPSSVKHIGENAFTYWSPEAAKELDLICYVSNEYAAQYCEAAGIKYEWAE